jgi:hypothetical protein
MGGSRAVRAWYFKRKANPRSGSNYYATRAMRNAAKREIL